MARIPSAALLLLPAALPASGQVYRFDFQNDAGPVAAGFTRVTPADAYVSSPGYGFQVAPRSGVDGSRHTWSLFGKSLSVDQVIPGSVLSDAVRDCVIGGRAPMEFRADVPPGAYDVTVWLGDVTTPRYQVRATINGATVDVPRMDVNHLRGNFDQSIFGNAVPRTVRVTAPGGYIHVVVGSHPDGARPVTWTYLQDEDPTQPPYERTATLVPAFSAAALQALTIHPAADPPLILSGGRLVVAGVPPGPELQQALDLFNAGDIAAARQAFSALSFPGLRAAKANGLFWVAGSPALLDDEPGLLAEAESLLVQVLGEKPDDYAAEDLLLQVRLAKDAERYRRLYGYAASGSSATENLGRSCSLVENFPPEHPYFLKGRILWLRNRGGLDPRRVTASWERAQWMARQLDAAWGRVNPYVHLYATDEWQNTGKPWSVIDWYGLTEGGPEWARALTANMNGWLDLFEWWSIHRQAPEGDIGGGWTDDVEIVPAFGLMSFVLPGASDICREAVLRFADGIWNSDIVDRERGYQRQYADVEHTAEPTGNILHMHPLVSFGDPDGMERIMKSARTFAEFFLAPKSGSPLGHRHFKGNHMSSTQIATNPNHRADIALNGRVTGPFPFLVWYSGNPGAETPLRDWIASWVADSMRTDNRKPAGVFPNMIWTPSDGIGTPEGDWWSRQNTYGQFGAFPAYQYYLYNLAGYFFLRTGDPVLRSPFDALQSHTASWVQAGRPALGDMPVQGQEGLWAGGKLKNVPLGAVTNLRVGSGLRDWDGYLNDFAGAYSRFMLDPTDDSNLADLAGPAQSLVERWPYRTTEGVMTDRILVPGWADAISYYIGADIFSVFFGMPVMAATWENTSRLFAAAVTRATRSELEATTYLFSDAPRQATLRLWQLARGGDYVLEAGPSDGLGLGPRIIDQTVPFTLQHLGDGVTFNLPGRTVYALRIRQIRAGGAGPAPLLPDAAVASRDISYDASKGLLTVRIHNIGSSGAVNIRVSVFRGADAGGAWIGTQTISLLDAPVDLMPRYVDLTFPYAQSAPEQVTVVLELQSALEITRANNSATAWVGAPVADPPPPMLISAEPSPVSAGQTVRLTGRNFQAGLAVMESEAPAPDLELEFLDSKTLELTLPADLPAGVLLLSVENPDGKGSNLLPLWVTAPPAGAHVLRFAQFADGAGISSKIILFNPGTGPESAVSILLRDDQGRPLSVDLNGQPVAGSLQAQVPAGGVRFFETDGLGARVVGSAAVHSDQPLKGWLVYGGAEGLAGVEGKEAAAGSFVTAVMEDAQAGVFTGIAIANREDVASSLRLELRDSEGALLATAGEALAAQGHMARYVREFSWTPAPGAAWNIAGLRGLLRVEATTAIAGTALHLAPGEFSTLPVLLPCAGPCPVRDLFFAQFVDGVKGATRLASRIVLINRSDTAAAEVVLTLRDDEGRPLVVDLNGEIVPGVKSLTIPAGGMRVLETDGAGAWTVGSAVVRSTQPLAGVLLFSGTDGRAGVGAAEEMTGSIAAPVDNDAAGGAHTGIAAVNLEEQATSLTLELLDSEGAVLASSSVSLPPGGHLARFLHEFPWQPAAPNVTSLRGLLRVTPTGRISATVLLVRPAQLATLPLFR